MTLYPSATCIKKQGLIVGTSQLTELSDKRGCDTPRNPTTYSATPNSILQQIKGGDWGGFLLPQYGPVKLIIFTEYLYGRSNTE
jgi:hypothetical protein